MPGLFLGYKINEDVAVSLQGESADSTKPRARGCRFCLSVSRASGKDLLHEPRDS